MYLLLNKVGDETYIPITSDNGETIIYSTFKKATEIAELQKVETIVIQIANHYWRFVLKQWHTFEVSL